MFETPTREPNAYAGVTVQVDDDNYISMEHWNTAELVAVSNIADELVKLASVPFDPVAHAYWRIREASGVSYWETSADGVAWTLLVSRPDPIPVGGLAMVIGAGTNGRATVSPGAFRVDDVNVVP